MTLYIVRVQEEDEIFDYEYSNLKHATEHFEEEETASLIEYKDGIYHLVK